jgi:hypothetical protein
MTDLRFLHTNPDEAVQRSSIYLRQVGIRGGEIQRRAPARHDCWTRSSISQLSSPKSEMKTGLEWVVFLKEKNRGRLWKIIKERYEG